MRGTQWALFVIIFWQFDFHLGNTLIARGFLKNNKLFFCF